MSPAELVRAVAGAGADVVIEKSGMRLVGPKLHPDIVEGIRADKAAFLEQWGEELRSRYGRVPEGPLPMTKTTPRWSHATYKRVESYIRRQGDRMTKWCFHRGNSYVEAGLSIEAGARCALRDLLYWQLRRHARPEEILEGMEECVKGAKS
jgi:hypothetical protein